MSIDRHDPRLTSYALGELDPREAAILEAELGESPDGQRALAEIRQTSELLARHSRPNRRRRCARPPAAKSLPPPKPRTRNR